MFVCVCLPNNLCVNVCTVCVCVYALCVPNSGGLNALEYKEEIPNQVSLAIPIKVISTYHC